MDFTLSPQHVVHPGTGQRMHDQNQAIPTQVTDKDLNSLLWSFMAILQAGGVTGMQFNPDNPATYNRVLTALRNLFNPVERVKVVGTLGDDSGSPFRPNINACIEFSSGHMLQVGGGLALAAAGATGTLISFPVAFEEACYQVIATDYGAGIPVLGVSPVDGNLAQFRAWAKDGTVGSYQNAYFRYLAFGK